jgi:hypothetical protein
MACACQGNKNAGNTAKSVTTVVSKTGTETSFGNRQDAELFASRTGGRIK